MNIGENGPTLEPVEPDRPQQEPWASRVKHFFLGHPRDLMDQSIFHRLSLIPILAWIGLGADGLSSSSYGPQEAFATLGQHSYLAVGLALATALTVGIISYAYSRIIEQFPHGGGGYVVATKLLGKPAGVVSGCALLVDYVLTITVSVAAAGDALFSFLPLHWHTAKLSVEVAMILVLTIMNARGVRESVLAMAPIFIVFLVTHVVLIAGGIFGHLSELPATVHNVQSGFSNGLTTLGAWGMVLLFVRAYSMGGGTYTGLEAVSNGLPILREPRVKTGRRTMVYMATSLAFTAGGLILCYLLWHVGYEPGKTMNAVLLERFTYGVPFGSVFVIAALLSEGGLLFVAAQAGFIDGPRVLANMAIDSWMPHQFSALSERLTTQNGVILMGLASMAALIHSHGAVSALVVMYSINVFLTFSLSMFGMARHTWATRTRDGHWHRRFGLFGFGFMLCATILAITILEKFAEGGWITVTVTSGVVFLCFAIRKHYRGVGTQLVKLYSYIEKNPLIRPGELVVPEGPERVAAVLVSAYGGVGIFAVESIFKTFPAQFNRIVFLSVGLLNSGGFKGRDAIEELWVQTENNLAKYVEHAEKLGIKASYRMVIGTDVIHEAERMCVQTAKEHPNTIFFAGKVVFLREAWYQRILHNDAALAIQKRLQLKGQTMVILPATVG